MRRYLIFVLILILSCLSSCAQNKLTVEQRTDIKRPGYNVIAIIIDCCRADHLSCYGYFRKTSPNIDTLAREGVLFEQAITQGPNTLLSFSSTFTSKYVSSHGVNSQDRRLSDSALTLAEVLKIYNYRTASFAGGLLLYPMFGLNQGFDDYFCDKDKTSSFNDILPPALDWIKERKEKREKFFLLIHGNDLHLPYTFPSSSIYDKDYKGQLLSMKLEWNIPFVIYQKQIYVKEKNPVLLDDKDVKYLTAQYDEGINYVDGLIGDFLDKLRTLKLLDKTIIILAADHGEELFDHDWFFHDYNLYEGSIRVPLIIRIPHYKGKGKRVTRQVQLIDLMPTILELNGIEVNEEAEGHSLLPLLAGKANPGFNKYVFCENSMGGTAVRTNKWKLIYYPDKVELYNLKDDPKEKNNLAETKPKITRKFIKKLLAWQKKRQDYNLSLELSVKNGAEERARESKEVIQKAFETLPKLKTGGGSSELFELLEAMEIKREKKNKE